MKAKEETKEQIKEFELPEKVVKVVPNIKPTAFIPNTDHVASFLAPRARKEFVVPYLRNGQLKNILTKEEKDKLEQLLNEDLSVYKKHDNFWLSFKFDIGKETVFLDLSNPIQYIQYKLLLAWPSIVSPTKDKKDERPTYKYYIVDTEYETVEKAMEDDIEEQAWTTFAELKNDRNKMINVLKLYGKNVGSNATDKFISTQISEQFRKGTVQMQEFVDMVNDPDFEIKILIERAVDANALVRRRSHYFLPEGDKLAASTSQMVEYLKDAKHQDVFMLIEQRTKNAK